MRGWECSVLLFVVLFAVLFVLFVAFVGTSTYLPSRILVPDAVLRGTYQQLGNEVGHRRGGI